MTKVIVLLLMLCTTEQFFIGGRWTTCTKCCDDYGRYCTTTCS